MNPVFGSPIVQPASTDYYTLHLWDPRDNVAQLTHNLYDDYYVDALNAHQLVDFVSATADADWSIPFVDRGFWAVHGALRTYQDVGDAFTNSEIGGGEHYWDLRNDVQQYLGQPLLDVPDGYYFVGGAYIPIG